MASECRRYAIEEQYHFALTGHSDGVAGRKYGNSPDFDEVLYREICKVKSPV